MATDNGRAIGCGDVFAPRLGHGLDVGSDFAPARQVANLVRARWIVVFILFLYAIYAGVFYSLSSYGFFLSGRQISFFFLTLCAVVAYNLAYQNASSPLSRFRYSDELQVFLDQILVTVLIHFTGGAASWVWTLYLIVSTEAVYLLKRRSEVWVAWCTGGFLYGALLVSEHGGLLRPVAMPFVDPKLAGDGTFLLLIWFWVVILTAAISGIGFHLMSAARGETLQLKESRERLFSFLEHAEDLIQMNAPDGGFLYANRAWLKTMGYEKSELARLNLFDLLQGESRPSFDGEFAKVLRGGESGTVDIGYVSRDGRVIDVEGHLSCSFRGNDRDAVWGIYRDVTQKKQAAQELYRMAHHDGLTDLPNRQLFMDRLQQLRGMMNRMGLQLAVFYLDLDGFKSINDTFGHAFGDKLLQAVASRLAGSVRETDTVARLGGDEFVIALGNLRDLQGAEVVARKVISAFSAPFEIESKELVIGTSIGISIYPTDAGLLDDLVEKADRALYRAKGDGRGCYRFYHDLAEIA